MHVLPSRAFVAAALAATGAIGLGVDIDAQLVKLAESCDRPEASPRQVRLPGRGYSMWCWLVREQREAKALQCRACICQLCEEAIVQHHVVCLCHGRSARAGNDLK